MQETEQLDPYRGMTVWYSEGDHCPYWYGNSEGYEIDSFQSLSELKADIDKQLDDDNKCVYCGQNCFEGQMCDEFAAGGFSEISS